MTEAHATRDVRCPRSDRGFGLGSLSLAVVPLIAGVSGARLRFRAAIRSITGGGVITSRGLIGPSSSLALIKNTRAILSRLRRTQQTVS